MSQAPLTPITPAILSDADKKTLANQQALGRDLATQLHICIRTASIYDSANENFRKQLGKLQTLLEAAFDAEAEVSVKSVDGYLFFNDQRLKINLDGYLAAKSLQEQYEKLKVAGLAFRRGVSVEELSTLLIVVSGRFFQGEGASALNAILTERQVLQISFIPSQTLVMRSDEKSAVKDRQTAKQTFFRAISVVQELFSTSTRDRNLNVIKAKRVVHSLVDQIIENENYMLGLTALKNFDQYTFSHCVNVSLFSIALGLRLGLTKARLAELGFAALFHDFGKMGIPIDLLNKPDGLNNDDWTMLQEHPIYGAKSLAQTFLLDRHTARSIIVAFEHHKNLDGTGYPYINRAKKINLYSRIVAICDFFDALTSGRIYRKQALPVDQVILNMIQQSNVKFDPYLLKVLINVIGIYPVGSLLLLDTGELALVVNNNPEDIFRPEVKIIADKNGKKSTPIKAHLSSFDATHNRHFRNVQHMIDPDKYGIDISEYIFGD